MQTALPANLLATPAGAEADRILRSCVHCGFCNATCPTYQLLGDELDGPRGRIYQIKQMLEGAAVSRTTLGHLDRCLTCRNCETTCPSGVEYGRLLEVGRELIEQRLHRPVTDRLARWLLRRVISHATRFAILLRFAQWLRPLLPAQFRRKVPPRRPAAPWPESRHTRHMLVLQGCVQPALAPDINAAAARVLDRLGIRLVAAAGAGCCGAASHHTSGFAEAREFARRNINAWWPLIEQGAEAIVMTASGCGVHVRDYAHLLRDDPDYAGRAKTVSGLTRDLAEILVGEDLARLGPPATPGMKIAFHSPCTLQHGQQLGGRVEAILRERGFDLLPVGESHLCCGSAGTYSILQPALSQQLLRRKLGHLEAGTPEVIATANIGCLMHLAGGSTVPVRHWIELLAPAAHA